MSIPFRIRSKLRVHHDRMRPIVEATVGLSFVIKAVEGTATRSALRLSGETIDALVLAGAAQVRLVEVGRLGAAGSSVRGQKVALDADASGKESKNR